jgi:hypothetical protein
MLTTLSRLRLLVVTTLIILGLSACGGSSSRGLFEGGATGLTEEAVIDKFGKPDVSDTSDGKEHRFTYKGRTFDSNGNGQKDNEAIVVFTKDVAGKFVATSFLFN